MSEFKLFTCSWSFVICSVHSHTNAQHKQSLESVYKHIWSFCYQQHSFKHSHQTANGITNFCLLYICSTSCNSPCSSEDHRESQTLTITFQQEHQQWLYSLWFSTSIFHTCTLGAKECTDTCNLGGKPLPSAILSLCPLKEIYQWSRKARVYTSNFLQTQGPLTGKSPSFPPWVFFFTLSVLLFA